MSRLITVFGATGAQGGSLVRALIDGGKYKIRGITRNPDSDASKALASKGVEMVKADEDDKNTLKAAMAGSYGVYFVSRFNFMQPDVDQEYKQARDAIDMAKEVGVEFFLYSGMESVCESSLGKQCRHFDGKNKAEAYLRASGLPHAVVRFSAYMENLLTIMQPKKVADNAYVLGIPMEGAPLDVINTAGTGPAVAAIFDHAQEYSGQVIGLTGDRLTVQQMAEALNKHLAPKKFSAAPITVEAFSKIPIPPAADLATMYEFYNKCEQVRSQELTRKLDPNTLSFEQWVVANKEALIAACQ